VIQAICGACGLDGAAVIVAAGKPKVAQMLKADTQKAISRGVFGAPSYVIEKEIFWGQDRVDFVGEKLGIA
jgi:2-hydroxychromene-2-carboxylate isomerase